MIPHAARYFTKIKWLIPRVGITGGIGGAAYWGYRRTHPQSAGQLRNCNVKTKKNSKKKTNSSN